MQDPLSRIDLNLLVAYQVLIQEKNVTRAAERLFVTQPAMSKTLNRLRNLLDDELFVRSPHGLTPTPKTQAMEKAVDEAIANLTELLVNTQEFTPATSSATISIGSLGTSAAIGIPNFLQRLSEEAPNLLVISQNLDADYENRLRDGTLDFAIAARPSYSHEFIAQRLMTIKPAIFMRKGHPLANKATITQADRRKYPHMAVYFPNFESSKEDIRKLFASFGISSRVPFLSANLAIALETLRSSDMLMIGSDRLIQSSLVREHFVSKPMTDLINLRIDTLSLVQHVRTKNSALHRYLAKLFVESFEESKA